MNINGMNPSMNNMGQNTYASLPASAISSQIQALNAKINAAGGILLGTEDVVTGDLINLELISMDNYNSRLAAATATQTIS